MLHERKFGDVDRPPVAHLLLAGEPRAVVRDGLQRGLEQRRYTEEKIGVSSALALGRIVVAVLALLGVL